MRYDKYMLGRVFVSHMCMYSCYIIKTNTPFIIYLFLSVCCCCCWNINDAIFFTTDDKTP